MESGTKDLKICPSRVCRPVVMVACLHEGKADEVGEVGDQETGRVSDVGSIVSLGMGCNDGTLTSKSPSSLDEVLFLRSRADEYLRRRSPTQGFHWRAPLQQSITYQDVVTWKMTQRAIVLSWSRIRM